jgi:peptidyl-prolyl cis-trans isomerase C
MKKTAAALHILVKKRNWQEILAKLERGISFDHLAKRL